MSRSLRAKIVALVFICSSTSGLSAGQRPPSSKWVEFKPEGLVGVADGMWLSYGIANTSKQPLWALVEFSGPNGDRLCEFIRRIEAGVSASFECALAAIAPDERYPLKLSVYLDDRLGDRVAKLDPVFRATQRDLAAAFNKFQATLDVPRPDPTATSDDAAASPPLPATFKPTWFRRVQRGFSLKAYEDSGQLTVNADALVFTADGKTLRIPFPQIISVRLDGMSRDLANDWVVVRFTGDDQKPDGVGFRDGTGLGTGNGTGAMYLTIRRAAKR